MLASRSGAKRDKDGDASQYGCDCSCGSVRAVWRSLDNGHTTLSSPHSCPGNVTGVSLVLLQGTEPHTEHVDTLIASGRIAEAAIIGQQGGVWANSQGLNVRCDATLMPSELTQ